MNIRSPLYGPSKAQTFAELLSDRADIHPDRSAIKFLADGDEVTHSLTYSQLHGKAAAIANFLTEHRMQGRCVLLVFPQGVDYAAAFFGCLYAGAIAVPAYPPRRNRNVDRLRSMTADSGAELVLSTSALLEQMQDSISSDLNLSTLSWQPIDDLSQSDFDPRAIASPNSVAFLQYTSGSTGSPKGVIVSNRNLIENQILITEIFGQREDETVMCGWLPMYHDMGLIGNLLHPIYLGGEFVLMSPFTFFQKPACWLQAITKHRATISGAPNFGYDMCVDMISDAERAELDLSSWNLAFNGAEPVRNQTLQRFTETFAPHGFSHTSFSPCFGMAETTLIVSGTRRPESYQSITVDHEALQQGKIELANSQIQDDAMSTPPLQVVSSGRPGTTLDVRIVDPESRIEMPNDSVGEVWVHGTSVTSGYWKKPEVTHETFEATIAGDASNTNHYLRTGDLGFIHEGELYVSGRLKDTIIIGGANHYPSDIEETVTASHPAMAVGSGVAFSCDLDGKEQVFIAHELKRSHWRTFDRDEVIGAIFSSVFQDHGISLAGIQLLRPGSIPKTTSGKLQRSGTATMFASDELSVVARWSKDERQQNAVSEVAARSPEQSSAPTDTEASANAQLAKLADLRAWLTDRVATQLKVQPKTISSTQPLSLYGLNSMSAVRIAAQLSEHLQRTVPPTLAYNYPTIDSICQHLVLGETNLRDKASRSSTETDDPVAVVGMACRFPGAPSLDEFWQLLASGQCAISPKRHDFPAGYIEDVDLFDPTFFAISPREADEMDPQQRIAMEVCWSAIENANIAPENLAGSRTGVFMGASGTDYQRLAVAEGHPTGGHSATGLSHAIVANRLSYFLDLHGPSVTIDTACSSSLVAVHQAAEAISRGECDAAIAGGVNLILDPDVTNALSEAGMLSPTGECKTFAHRANGFVRGEGCGAVILKRLSQAVEDQDNIVCVIRGSAVNQDGRSNGLTAPNGIAQQDVITAALDRAGVTPRDIDYVEAHGTGTELGDPIEMDALANVFDEREKSLQVGSVKTNIGHLEAAAGIAGFIKTCLALQNQIIPSHLGFDEPSPHIDWTKPIEVASAPAIWAGDDDHIRRAGISSFSFGGTNAHVIVEDFDQETATSEADSQDHYLIKFSAKSDEALAELISRFTDEPPEQAIAEIAASANLGRGDFSNRVAVIASSTADLVEKLANDADNESVYQSSQSSQIPTTFEQVDKSLASIARHYVSGGSVDWRSLHHSKRRPATLIGHPMLRQRCWFTTGKPVAKRSSVIHAASPAGEATTHELLGTRLDLASEAIVFEVDLSQVTYLQDHRLHGKAIFPTTGYIEQALSAATIVSATDHRVENLQLHMPLEIDPSLPCRVQVILSPEEYGFHFESKHNTGDGWQTYASCELLVGVDFKPTRPRKHHELQPSSISKHFSRCKSFGLDYGAAFTGLQSIRCSDKSAIGRIAFPDAAGITDGYRIHPAMLDACLQTLGPLIPSENANLWLPVALDKFQLTTPDAIPTHLDAYGNLRWDHSSESYIGDLSLFDLDGRELAQIEGLRLQTGKPIEPVSLYEEAWVPKIRKHEVTPLPTLNASEIAAKVESDRDKLLRRTRLLETLEGRGKLDALCRDWVIDCIVSLMGTLAAGTIITKEEVRDGLGIQTERQQSLHRMLEMLVEDSILEKTDEGWIVNKDLKSTNAREHGASLARQYDHLAADLTLVNRCGSQLPEVLVGEVDPLDLLFPKRGETTAADIYKVSPGARTINRLLGRAVRQIASSLPPGRGLRVLEIGAGTGGTTGEVLANLPAGRFHYDFTDLGSSFLSAAQQNFVAQGDIDYRVLDIERSPEEQGFEPGSIDIIVAANVLHATKSLNDTLHNVRKLLADGGQLLLLEGTRRHRWMDLTFGLTDGWWRFEDTDVRPDYPLANTRTWKQLLKDNRFEDVAVVNPLPESQTKLSENVVIVATADHTTPKSTQDHWTLIAGKKTGANRLAKQLGKHGCTCEVVDGSEIGSQISESLTEYPATHHYAFLAPKPSVKQDKSKFSRSVCVKLMQTLQDLIEHQTGPIDFALVSTEGSVDPTACALRSMIRAVQLERPEWRLRWIDATCPKNEFAKIVAAELLSCDIEPEIKINTDRHVRRLLLQDSGLCGKQNRVLRVSQPGSLDSVGFEVTSRRTPARYEVELSVLASGINYRDVLLAMGMYPGNAPLGAECIGRVTRVGEGVDSVDPGDTVIAFAEETFADFVNVSHDLITPLPKNLSCAEAATIPVAFLTASFSLEMLGDIADRRRVLIHSATGGVGLAAIQIAETHGVEIFTTASSSKHAELKERGINHVFDSRSDQFAEAILQATNGEGVDLILNTLPESMFDANMSVLAKGGVYVDITKPEEDLAHKFETLAPVKHPETSPTERPSEYYLFDLVELLRQAPDTAMKQLASVLDRFSDGSYKPLPYQSIPLDNTVDAMRKMQLARQIGKLVVVNSDSRIENRKLADFENVAIRSDSSYVIVGGLGDLGLLTASELAARGAGLIVLAGRSEPNGAQQDAIDRIIDSGTAVMTAQVDATKRSDIASLLESVRSEGLPIAGIIHSAGVLQDGFVENQDRQSFRKVFDVKACAAWHLHELTASDPLDLFVVYSSLASIIGAPGQSNHSAANGFLDGLVAYRQSNGLPGTAINWGPWSDIGEACRRGADERNDIQGIGVIRPAAGYQAIRDLLHYRSSSVSVAKINRATLPVRLRNLPVFSGIVSAADSLSKTPTNQMLVDLANANTEDRSALVSEYLNARIANILGISDMSRITTGTVLTDIGLDSLTALELRDSLQADLAVNLPASLVYDYPSIGQLSSFLILTVASKFKQNEANEQPKQKPDIFEESLRENGVAQLDEVTDFHPSDPEDILVAGQVESGLNRLSAELELWE